MKNRRRSKRVRPSPRRGGTAIVEFTLAIPLLAMVLLLTFSFGWAMTNQRHVWASDRYACWKQVRTGVRTSREQINQTFFYDRASSVSVDYDRGDLPGWSDTLKDYVGDVYGGSVAAGNLAEGLVYNRFPRDMRVEVHGEFPTKNLFWRRFTGPMRTRHSRAGVEWRWREARCENEVADQMLSSVDGLLATTPAPADGMARFFRSLYRQGWSIHDWPYGSDGNAN